MSSKNSFSSRLGFFAAAAGSAIGLCNIWKFPYEVNKYGGILYIAAYLFFATILAFPAVMADLRLGKRAQGGMAGAFPAFGKRGKALTGGLALLALIYFAFYSVIVGWLIGYLEAMLTGELLNCGDYTHFWNDLQSNIYSNLLYTIVGIVGVGLINQADLNAGLERWCKILLPILCLFLLLLVGYVLYLPGTFEQVKNIFTPSFDDFSWAGLGSAMTQSFLSLGLGCGIMITYGAYVSDKEDLRKAAGVIVFSDIAVALLAVLLILPLVYVKHGTVEQDTALVFISLPHIFASLGSVAGMVIGTIFFLLLIFAAVTSSIALLEVPVSYLQHAWGWSRRKSVGGAMGASILLSIPAILGQAGKAPFAAFVGKYSYFDFTILLTEALIPIVALASIAYVIVESKQSKEGAGWRFPLKAPYTYFYLVCITFIAGLNIWMKWQGK